VDDSGDAPEIHALAHFYWSTVWRATCFWSGKDKNKKPQIQMLDHDSSFDVEKWSKGSPDGIIMDKILHPETDPATTCNVLAKQSAERADRIIKRLERNPNALLRGGAFSLFGHWTPDVPQHFMRP